VLNLPPTDSEVVDAYIVVTATSQNTFQLNRDSICIENFMTPRRGGTCYCDPPFPQPLRTWKRRAQTKRVNCDALSPPWAIKHDTVLFMSDPTNVASEITGKAVSAPKDRHVGQWSHDISKSNDLSKRLKSAYERQREKHEDKAKESAPQPSSRQQSTNKQNEKAVDNQTNETDTETQFHAAGKNPDAVRTDYNSQGCETDCD
jgi:hypothetical protein